MYTIKDLSDGKVAVINDGTLEDLRKVLKMAFADDECEVLGISRFYLKSTYKNGWRSGGTSDLPTQSAKDFLSNENIDISDVCKSIIDLIKNKVYTEPGVFQAVVRDELMDAEKKQSIVDFLKKEDVNDFHIITKKTTTRIHVKY